MSSKKICSTDRRELERWARENAARPSKRRRDRERLRAPASACEMSEAKAGLNIDIVESTYTSLRTIGKD